MFGFGVCEFRLVGCRGFRGCGFLAVLAFVLSWGGGGGGGGAFGFSVSPFVGLGWFGFRVLSTFRGVSGF